MKIKSKLSVALLSAVASIVFSAPVSAAYIAIDDSDPTQITITAGDFEGGFYVNANLLTSGLGNSGSITLVDGGHTIGGSWIDLGAAGGQRVDVLFALPSNLTFATSGIEFGVTSDGVNATLSGSLGGFIDASRYYTTGLTTLLQNGQTGFGGVPFLSVSFISENVVPEPGTLALLGLGLAGLAALRRRKQ